MGEDFILNSNTSIPFHYYLSRKYRLLFNFTVFFLLITGILITHIRVPVIIHGRGIIRPEVDIIPVISAISGNIAECRIKDGMYVKKDDTLIVFNSLWNTREVELLLARQKLIEEYMFDLDLLIHNIFENFKSHKYKSEYNAYQSVIKEKENQKILITKELERARSLYRDLLISQKEFEDIEHKFASINNSINSYITSQIVKWADELEYYRNELHTLMQRLNNLNEILYMSVIKAPVNGIIHEMKGVTTGSYLYQHQRIGGISPDTGYFAEILIHPSDIDWIHPGIKGRILLDAYNSNYWEALSTECVFISDEITVYKDQPFFTARCSVNRHHPIIRNGHTGLIKKGMTLTVQFIITERSLLQLITDKISKWISIENGIK